MAKSKWLKSDKEYLKRHYGRLNTELLMQHLNRTQSAIHSMAGQLGITNNQNKLRKITKKQINKKRISDKRLRLNQRVYKTRPFTYEGKRAIKIDSKTILFVDANVTPDELDNILKQYNRNK